MVTHPVGPWGGNLVLAMTVTVMSGGASVFAQDVFSENFDSRAEAMAVGKLPGWERVWGSDVPIRSGLPIDPTGRALDFNAGGNQNIVALDLATLSLERAGRAYVFGVDSFGPGGAQSFGINLRPAKGVSPTEDLRWAEISYSAGGWHGRVWDGNDNVVLSQKLATPTAAAGPLGHPVRLSIVVDADKRQVFLAVDADGSSAASIPATLSKADIERVLSKGRLSLFGGPGQPGPYADNVTVAVLSDEARTKWKSVMQAEPVLSQAQYRRCLVSSKINPPDPFPGFANFLGWEDVIRLKNGDMLVTFCAGYWHVSFKTPVMLPPGLKKSYIEGGFRDIDAPRGGRIMYIRSSDNGLTWTKPETLIDSEWDDQEPSIVQLADGTLVHTFMVLRDWYGFPETPPGKKINSQGGAVRSFDNGQTWEKAEDVHWIETPMKYTDRNSAPAIVLPSGDLLLATCGTDSWGDNPKWKGPIYRSHDKGATWKLVSVIEDAPTAIDEPAIARLPSGRIVLITRPDGAVLMSDDEGKTWGKRVNTGVKMCAPHLVLQRDGTLVCVYGPGPPDGLQAIFSTDGGETWVTPGNGNVGFMIDPTVYGYPGACELPDGSIYCVYYDSAKNQQDTGVWAIRFRVTADKKGIELLPVPGAAGYGDERHGFGPQRAPDAKSVNIDAMGKVPPESSVESLESKTLQLPSVRRKGKRCSVRELVMRFLNL